MLYIVTVKLPKNPKHDPSNKQSGGCVFSEFCTDTTGEHHSKVVDAQDEAAVRAQFKGIHITRIERA